MPKSIAQVRVGVDGVVAVAPYGSVAPTSASSTLDAAYIDYGYVSEDGVTETTDVSSDKIKAWQKGKVVRTSVTESSIEWKLVLIQTSAQTVALYYNGVVQADGSIIADPSKDRPVLAFVLDIIDGTDRIRKYAPEAQITEVGDQVFANGEPIGYEVTVTANYNEALTGSMKQWTLSLATPIVPTITTALPTAQAVGEVVTLVGTGFFGVTGVTVGGVAATFDVLNEAKMFVTLPAGSAGSAPIIVTASGGASSAKAYTRA